MSWARCRSCDAPIVWGKVRGKDGKMKAIPLDADVNGELILFDNGNLAPSGVVEKGGQPVVRYVTPTRAYRTHFVSCPQSASWRRKS